MMDMTKGKPSALILKFALPMIIGNIFQQLYNVVDTIVVGKFIGKDALAAVGSSFAIVVFITSIIIGLCMGAGVVFSNLYGSKDFHKLSKAVFTSFIFTMAITIAIMLISLFFIDDILKLFRMPSELLYDGKTYLSIILKGLFFTFIYNATTSLLRALGDSKAPLYFLIIAAIINVILDLFFVLSLHMGVSGVAWATIIAQLFSAILSLIYTYRKLPSIGFKFSNMAFDMELFKISAKYSILTSIQQSIMNFGILLVQGLVNTFGSTVMAAFAAGVKIDSFSYMPVQDLGNAFSTYVAQNVGANEKQRVKEGLKAITKIIIIFCIIVSSLILIFSKELMLLFVSSSEKEVISLGVEYISVVGIFYMLIGFLFMFYGFYRGMGYLNMSIILTIISLGTRVLLAYSLAPTVLGVKGIWFSIPIGWALADLIGFYFYQVKLSSR